MVTPLLLFSLLTFYAHSFLNQARVVHDLQTIKKLDQELADFGEFTALSIKKILHMNLEIQHSRNLCPSLKSTPQTAATIPAIAATLQGVAKVQDALLKSVALNYQSRLRSPTSFFTKPHRAPYDSCSFIGPLEWPQSTALRLHQTNSGPRGGNFYSGVQVKIYSSVFPQVRWSFHHPKVTVP